MHGQWLDHFITLSSTFIWHLDNCFVNVCNPTSKICYFYNKTHMHTLLCNLVSYCTVGAHRWLYVHLQRARSSQPWPSGQDGELLPGGDSEVPLPALHRRRGAHQPGQVRLQHRGPPPAHMDPGLRGCSTPCCVIHQAIQKARRKIKTHKVYFNI